MFGLKRFFEKMTGVTRRSSDSISEEAARKAAALTAEIDKATIADIRRSGYALADPANSLSLKELVAIQVAERQVDIKVDVERVAPATITFDPDTNRATDAASGMAVEYVADDYPMERGAFWKLIWKSSVHNFRVDVNCGLSLNATEPGLRRSRSLGIDDQIESHGIQCSVGLFGRCDGFLIRHRPVSRLVCRCRPKQVEIL